MIRRFFAIAILFGVRTPGQVASEGSLSPLRLRLFESSISSNTKTEVLGALDRNDLVRAEGLLVSEIQRAPANVELLQVAAGVFFLNHEYLNSAISFKKAEALKPLRATDRFTLAMAYIELKREDWARPELQKLADEDPTNPLYIYWQARLDYDESLYAAAVVKLHQAIALDGKFARAYDNLGLSLEALGKLDEASGAYGEAARLNRQTANKSAWPPLNLGSLLLKMGRTGEAETYLREAVSYNPKSPEALYRLGVLLERQGKFSQAIDHLQRAVSLKRTYAEPYYALGRIYRRIGDGERANQAFAAFQNLKSGHDGTPALDPVTSSPTAPNMQ